MSGDEDQPVFLGLGACHELGAAGRTRPRRRKEPIGFIHFGAPKRTTQEPRRKPPAQNKARRPGKPPRR